MFERFNLRDTAFPVTPTEHGVTGWYGFRRLKDEFEATLRRSTSENPSLCVLNRGRLGAGKTHAARYFLAKCTATAADAMYAQHIPLMLEAPKQPQNAFVDFTTRLLEVSSSSRLLEAATNIRALMGQDSLRKDLIAFGTSEDVATTLAGLTDANLLLTRAFLNGGGTSKELRTMGVAKRIGSDHEFACVVKGVMYLLIHGQSSTKPTLRRVLLWIDEMEDLVFFPTRYYLPFTQALREVFDGAREHLTVMLNFTFSEPAELPAIENVLGQAIMQRVNHHIVFEEPTANDFREYLKELFTDNRIRQQEGLATFPFSEESFSLLCEATNGKTPRFLNKLTDMLLRDLAKEINLSAVPPSGLAVDLVKNRLLKVAALMEESRG